MLKELVDNALDEMDRVGQPGQVTITQDSDDTYTVTDQGRGFADSPEELARRFSLDNAMTSSKQWRRPTRGCVGNGLRVIVGSVVGSGRIIVLIIQMKFALPQAKKFGGIGNLFLPATPGCGLLDRARAIGDNLGSRRIMERQLRCHVGCPF